MNGRALLLGGVVLVVTATVVGAFFVLDSPAEERRRRLDEQRVSDLSAISQAVDAYWTREGTLPADLDDLAGWEGFDVSATDPVTEAPYGYRVTGETTYELCADFATEAPGREGRDRQRFVIRRHNVSWHHPAGEHCFELEVEEVGR